MKPSDESIDQLRERVRVLTGEREATKRILEAAVDSLAFPVVVDETFSSDVLLAQAAQKLRSFIKLDALVFYLFTPDGLDFFPAFCDPPERLSFFEEEMIPLVDDGTFAWAVDRNKPVIITARPGKTSAGLEVKERQLLLHSIMSSNRSIGMFMSLLGEDETDILDVSFAFFTVLLGSMASILHNAELYTMIQGLNNELQGKIKRLEESERSLAEAMKAKEVFLANVSHEVRTPLNGIVGMTTLLEETPLDARQRELLGVLKDESGALLRLINDLLDFSKMEAGKLVFEDAPFDLYELWNSVRDSFLPRAVAKNLSFSMTLDESAPRVVSGDSFRIRQVLGNLVGNAVKFTGAGSVEVNGNCLARREE
ncbi:MAG TPA: histidine kinase dimerization/phospho-acceptor domain-containing protein, partial [Aminobacteriaceae bacterium]|nr:histidine kinase dimerization/phospho-acceptor domain-containing protein [Aminobacteriaceae bacterium]